MQTADVPLTCRVQLTHGVLQKMADAAGIDILFVKGPAVDEALLQHREVDGSDVPIPRHSTDADVVVRPAQVELFQRCLLHHGWRLVADFDDGSPFGHAANYWHDLLGYIDLHRRFPGIEMPAEQAFTAMWTSRHTTPIAHVACTVPSVDVQRLVLLLHAARSGSPRHPDKVPCWDEATAAERDRVRRLAREMDAEVGLAAAIGTLEEHRDARTYDLWRQFSTGDTSRLREWRARIKAAPNRREAARVALHSLRLNQPHLRMDLGHDLTRGDILRGYVRRTNRAVDELSRIIGRRVRHWSGRRSR